MAHCHSWEHLGAEIWLNLGGKYGLWLSSRDPALTQPSYAHHGWEALCIPHPSAHPVLSLTAYISSSNTKAKLLSLLFPTEATRWKPAAAAPLPTHPPMLLGMSACSRKALTLLSSVFAVCGLGLLGISVSTDYWLYLEEGIVQPQNQSAEIKLSLHAGLWRVCFLAGTASSSSCPHPTVIFCFQSQALRLVSTLVRWINLSQHVGLQSLLCCHHPSAHYSGWAATQTLCFVPAKLGFGSAETFPHFMLLLAKQCGSDKAKVKGSWMHRSRTERREGLQCMLPGDPKPFALRILF